VGLELGGLGQRGAGQVGQGQVVEEDLHEFFLAEVEDEVVLRLTGVGGLATAAPLAAAALGPLDAVAAHVILVAGVHHLALAALAVSEHRLGDVALGDVDVLPLRHVADAAPVDRALHRLADLLLVAAQKALAVADGLVLPGESSIDDLLEHAAPSGHHQAAGAAVKSRCPHQELLRTRRYHSHSSRTCLGV